MSIIEIIQTLNQNSPTETEKATKKTIQLTREQAIVSLENYNKKSKKETNHFCLFVWCLCVCVCGCGGLFACGWGVHVCVSLSSLGEV